MCLQSLSLIYAGRYERRLPSRSFLHNNTHPPPLPPPLTLLQPSVLLLLSGFHSLSSPLPQTTVTVLILTTD